MSWQERALGDLCSLITDGKHGDCRNEEKSNYYFISCKDIKDGRIIYDNARQIMQADFAETHRRTDLKPGDVLLTNSGTIGRLAIAQEDEKTPRTTFQKSVAILKPIQSEISSHFLYYSLAADTNRLVNSAGGAAQKNLLLGELRRYTIKAPDLTTQSEISSILRNYDDLIENNRRRIKLLEESARILYKEWFVHLRFPGHEHVKIKNGIPEGWDICKISDLGDVITGKTPSTKVESNYGGDIPFIKTPDMHGVPFVIKTEQTLTENGANTQANKYVSENSVMVSCIGTVGIVAMPSTVSQTNQQINTVSFRENHLKYYCYFAFTDLRKRLEAIGGGATMSNINKTKFSAITIVKPSTPLLQAFEENAEPIFSQMKTLLIFNEKLTKARDILLPRLMNGEITV
jgi:type I restriction enzyme S subunit